jgi:hypothetical protein
MANNMAGQLLLPDDLVNYLGINARSAQSF